MSLTSKTGLLPTAGKRVKTEAQETVTPNMPCFGGPAPFVLRPFAGVYNPFPYGCSILCNHPADFEAKSIVKKAKDAWAMEGKLLVDLDEHSVFKQQEKTNQNFFISTHEDQDQVPEELFRKYTCTDSRPVTPAPTLASFGTKSSAHLRTRRCMTPDLKSITKEKTLLVLDLRRSHSQETICWLGGQTTEDSFEDDALQKAVTSRATSPSGQNASQAKKKKTPRRKTPTATPSLKSDNSRDSDSKVHTSGSQSPSKASVIQEQPPKASKSPQQISPGSTDADGVRRRGKKRKGKKTGKDGEKEVKGIPDPGETQVSALENDSKEGSSRASLTGEENLQTLCSEEITPANPEAKSTMEQINNSFLKMEILRLLQRQLDQEVVDSELNAKRKIALQEALRCKVNPKHVKEGEELKTLKKEFQLSIKNLEKWLSIPRVFSRRSARFELPMDSRLLKTMTPLQYVQNYVFPSPERLVLYNHLFNLYKQEPEDDDDSEEIQRILLGKNVITALGKIMGREMTLEESQDLQKLLDWKDDAALDFRTFAGISAACERLLGPRFCSKMLSHKEDPRHEVEIADFEALEGKLLRQSPDRRLASMLRSIRDL